MPDKTMRIDLDLYNQVAKIAEKADRTPETDRAVAPGGP